MNISILTLFPEMFQGPFDYSIIKRAKEKNFLTLSLINIRDFATDKRRYVDDRPYGGGAGMILRVDIVDRAISSVKKKKGSTTILLDPKGVRYSQAKANNLTIKEHIILVCGHYEGVDSRIEHLVDEVISVGDFVMTGGELAAMVIVDTVTRLLPGVLTKEEASLSESFSLTSQDGCDHFLEYPQYTKPLEYKGMLVPDVLLSGNHAKIETWRKEESRKCTARVRPDLLHTKLNS